MNVSHVLAVVPVSDIDRSVAWYERLLGRPADARPMATLADFHVSPSGWLQVFADADRAGTVAVNLAVDDLDRTRADLQAAGFDVSGEFEVSRGVRLIPLADPDGSTVSVVGNLRRE